MKTLSTILTMALLSLTACSTQGGDSDMKNTPAETSLTAAELQAIPFETITGDSTSLADYSGKVLLLVNTASKCGYTPQYEGLEQLYKKYADSGLVVIGFPANNFGGQEPGTNEEILNFCQTKFDVTFPMMAKVSVKGDDKHTLFKALTEQSNLPGEIKWNFSKFLVDRNGNLVARWGSSTEPMSDDITGAIEKQL